MQEYIEQSAQREANGEAATIPTPEELQQMIADLSDGYDNPVRGYIRASIQSFEQLRRIEQLRVMEEESRPRPGLSEEEEAGARMPSAEAGDMIASVGGDVDLDQLADAEEEEEEEDIKIQLSPSPVDEFLQTLVVG